MSEFICRRTYQISILNNFLRSASCQHEFTRPTENCSKPFYFYTRAKEKAREWGANVKQKGVGPYPLPRKVSGFALSSCSLAPGGGKMRHPGNEVGHGAGGAICSKNSTNVPYHRCRRIPRLTVFFPDYGFCYPFIFSLPLPPPPLSPFF